MISIITVQKDQNLINNWQLPLILIPTSNLGPTGESNYAPLTKHKGCSTSSSYKFLCHRPPIRANMKPPLSSLQSFPTPPPAFWSLSKYKWWWWNPLLYQVQHKLPLLFSFGCFSFISILLAYSHPIWVKINNILMKQTLMAIYVFKESSL